MDNSQLDKTKESALLKKKKDLMNEIRQTTDIFKALADRVRQENKYIDTVNEKEE
ncbi:hypothetical protein ACYCSE_14305 [Paenibacillus sp. SEL1]